MLITRRELPILVVNLIYVSIFAVVSLRELNLEFLLYVGVVIAIILLILWKQKTVQFDRPILWGLTIWGMLHLAGGNIPAEDSVLYSVILIDVIPQYDILRYDQLVHMFGFGVATLVCFHLLRPFLRDGIARWLTLSLLVVLMGSGLGAVNEIVEFIAEQTVPETYVGGYVNTSLDLIFNLVGGLLAVTWLALRRRSGRSDKP